MVSPSIPTRVSFTKFGKITTRVFGSREAAEEFGLTVKDPEYQDAKDPAPSQVSAARRVSFNKVMRKKVEA